MGKETKERPGSARGEAMQYIKVHEGEKTTPARRQDEGQRVVGSEPNWIVEWSSDSQLGGLSLEPTSPDLLCKLRNLSVT